jgi:hypothetical protein
MHVPEDHIRAFDREQIGERIGDADSPGIECPADVESPHSGIGHLLGLKVAEEAVARRALYLIDRRFPSAWI